MLHTSLATPFRIIQQCQKLGLFEVVKRFHPGEKHLLLKWGLPPRGWVLLEWSQGPLTKFLGIMKITDRFLILKIKVKKLLMRTENWDQGMGTVKIVEPTHHNIKHIAVNTNDNCPYGQ